MLITNTDVGKMSGDMTLIYRRAEAMYYEKGIFTNLVVYKGLPQSNSPYLTEYCSVVFLTSYNDICSYILKMKPGMIVLYGTKIGLLTYPLHRFIKKNNLDTLVFLDVQSAIEEVKEYPSNLKRKFFYPVYEWSFVKAINDVDGAFVVSNELIKNCELKRKNKKNSIMYYKIRCGINKTLSEMEIIANRKEIRDKYGIDENATLFTYSGYRTAWQKVDKIIIEFQKYDRVVENAFFMFFCNIDNDFENLLKVSFPKGNYILKFLKKDEYEKMLCACDVGYILRDYNETNRVAFPNKFSDYLASGLIVALNKALPEPMRIVENFPSHYIDTDHDDITTVVSKIRKRKENYVEFLKTNIDICTKELLYSSQIEKLEL